MKKHIAEELPARKHAPAAAVGGGKDKKEEGGKSPEKRVKQAIYDIRYRARREELPLQQAYSQYMANSSMSQQEKTLVKQKLFGKGGQMKEDYQIEELASNSIASALYKVFVEGVEKEEEPIRLTYMEKLDTAEHRKYKVRVTGKDGRSYVRYADRQKINDLRANPNIESVEMTGYGEPYEGEKKKGEQTARAKAGKGLDPVGKEDGDIDNNGDKDKTDSYLLNRRKVRGAAISKRKGVSEDFIHEGESSNPDANDKKIDVMKGKNKVVISPQAPGSARISSTMVAHHEMEGPFIVEKAVSQAQQRFMGMVYAAKQGKPAASPEVAKAAAGMSKKEAKKFAKTKHKGLPVHKEEADCGCDNEPKLKKGEGSIGDARELPTKINLAKNKLRAMGVKNPIVMVASEETVDEGMGIGVGLSRLAGAIGANPKTSAEQGARNFQRNLADPVGFAVKGAIRQAGQSLGAGSNQNKQIIDKRRPQTPLQKQVAARTQQVVNQSYEPEGEVIDERRREEKEAGTPRAPRNRAVEIVKDAMRQQTGKPAGQRKKVPGKKPPVAGQYGAPQSPAQRVALRRAAARRSEENQSSRFD